MANYVNAVRTGNLLYLAGKGPGLPGKPLPVGKVGRDFTVADLRGQGYDAVVALAKGTPDQRAMAQDAINRWWYPTLMMSGPPDKASEHTEKAMRWRIKTKTNDQIRQEFVDLIVPQIRALGLDVPDPACRKDDGPVER